MTNDKHQGAGLCAPPDLQHPYAPIPYFRGRLIASLGKQSRRSFEYDAIHTRPSTIN